MLPFSVDPRPSEQNTCPSIEFGTEENRDQGGDVGLVANRGFQEPGQGLLSIGTVAEPKGSNPRSP